jgi:hypothetical protein
MQNIDKRLDAAWSELVKLRANYQCEVCGKTKNLNSHHIWSRIRKSVRWDVQNGVCLCVGCHVGPKSAHKDPMWFADWIRRKRGEDWYNMMTLRANSTGKRMKFEKELLLKELKKEIRKLQ